MRAPWVCFGGTPFFVDRAFFVPPCFDLYFGGCLAPDSVPPDGMLYCQSARKTSDVHRIRRIIGIIASFALIRNKSVSSKRTRRLLDARRERAREKPGKPFDIAQNLPSRPLPASDSSSGKSCRSYRRTSSSSASLPPGAAPPSAANSKPGMSSLP